jgi:FkbM family methyltransferase
MSIPNRKSFVEALLAAATNPQYRKFLYFLLRYKNAERYKKKIISIGKYRLTVVDMYSFIFQYKDIFVDGYYKFLPFSKVPVIYDCGANVGTSVLYFHQHYPQSKIYAFEADPDIAAVLQENVERNLLEHVKVIPQAVWKDGQGVRFQRDQADGGLITNKESESVSVVPSVRLSALLQQEKMVDLLKMDIEGAEFDVIPDCQPVLHKVRYLYLECHAWKGSTQKLGMLLDVLTKAGFKYYITPVQKIQAPLANTAKITDEDLQFHLFAVNMR